MNENEKQEKSNSADYVDFGNQLKNYIESTSNSTGSASLQATKVASDLGKEAAHETGKEIAKEAAKTTAQETAKEATMAVTSGAATGGVGTIASLAFSGAKLAVKETSNKAPVILLFLFFCTYIFTAIGASFGNSGSASTKYWETNAAHYREEVTGIPTKQLDTSFFDSIFGFLKGLFGEVDSPEETVPGIYDGEYPLQDSLEKNLKAFNKVFRKAYQKALFDLDLLCVQNGYDRLLTIASFYENPYPFENINYAELICILSQKDTFDIENLDETLFADFLKPSLFNPNLSYLYKIKVEEAYKDIWVFKDNDEVEQRVEEFDVVPESYKKKAYALQIKYGKVSLVRYDQKNLYAMLELDPYSENRIWSSYNIDTTDSQEKYLRFYARDFDLGPNTRTVWDNGFDSDSTTTGESIYEELLKLYDGDISEAQQNLIYYAMSKLGTTYSQAHRNEEGYFDCSSFVSWVYRQIGISFGGFSPTAAGICNYLDKAGTSIGTTDVTNLQVGDVVFYSSKENGRYKNITHVALYVGDGKIVDASSTKGQVVYRDLWGSKQIVDICRPLVSE